MCSRPSRSGRSMRIPRRGAATRRDMSLGQNSVKIVTGDAAKQRPSGGPPEEPALEWAEQLLANERLSVDRPAVAFRHADIVLKALVRVLKRVVELVTLKYVLVLTRLVRSAQLRIDRAPDRPHRAGLALDPDDDP